jgi:antitoxin YefM
MSNLKISEDLRTVSELKGNAAEIVQQASDTGRPVVLTKHGRGVAVLLGVEQYEMLVNAAERAALTEALRQGEADIAQGRVKSHRQVRARHLNAKSR